MVSGSQSPGRSSASSECGQRFLASLQNWVWLRWLEERGLLDVLEAGTTPQFRPGAWASEGHNLAREWRLTVPFVEINDSY